MSPLLVAGFALATGFGAGFFLFMRYRARLAFGIAALMGAVFLYCMLVPKEGQGFEDIGYAIVAFLIAMPAGLGVLTGCLIAWMRRRRLE